MGSYWVFAKIVCVESQGNWWYLSCKKCAKKLTAVGKNFYCEKCDNLESNGNMRYVTILKYSLLHFIVNLNIVTYKFKILKHRFKIHVRVVDVTGNAVFLIWDKECIDLFGKTAFQLKTEIEDQVFLLYFSNLFLITFKDMHYKIITIKISERRFRIDAKRI